MNDDVKHVYSFNLNYSDFVVLQTNASHRPITKLRDTHADISVIKESALENKFDIDTSEIMRIKGVTSDVVESFCKVWSKIHFDECVIEHIFRVAPNSFNIPADGILGKDFNKIFKCKIDYGDMSLAIRVEGINITVPIKEEPRENTMSLPAWCRTFRVFSIENFTKACLMPA